MDMKDDEEFLDSMEYLCESVVNGQYSQVYNIFDRGGHTIEDFYFKSREYGLSEGQIETTVCALFNHFCK